MIQQCGKQAVAVYHWPTYEPMAVCLEHLEFVREAAVRRGFKLLEEPATDEATCQQLIRRGS